MSVQKCPVCEGRGTMPAQFYNEHAYAETVACKSCHGDGVIVQYEYTQPPTVSPWPWPDTIITCGTGNNLSTDISTYPVSTN